MYQKGLEILKILEDNGFKAYIVGGFVRDKLLGINNDDIDITTNARPDQIKELFDIYKNNEQFGNVIINYDNYKFEITTFRKEVKYNGRYPEIEFIDSLEEDLKRRDFTINTLCIDKDGKLVDLYNSKRDLDNKLIRSVDSPLKKIKEDPIRILRAIRFSSNLNFNLEEELLNELLTNKQLINNISKSQIEKEVLKMNNKARETIKKYGIDKYMKGTI